MLECIITLNVGSSSVKFSLFAAKKGHLLFYGEARNIFSTPTLSIKDGNKEIYAKAINNSGHHAAINEIVNYITSNTKDLKIISAGHRIVHGGREFSIPVIIDNKVINKLRELIPLAPLHQPYNLEAITAVTSLGLNIPQVACFDTGFHHNQPWISKQFALPRSYMDDGIIRYGFHGLSYQYITSILPQHIGDNAYGRIIVAHLGNGASMCAMKNLQSVASTMGFTALEGLIMGTRCGSIDPGVILYMLQEKKLTPEQITHILYKDSGLKGVSGISNNMQTLLSSSSSAAKEAVDLFCYQAAKQLSSLIPSIGGIDAIIFTAGIGENSSIIRHNICSHLSWLGLKLNDAANEDNNSTISATDSTISIHVIPTNEEYVIFKSTLELLGH